jgi:Leucine-rich repeat (LRR) protein
LEKIPKGILFNESIEELLLDGNKIKSVPPEIENMKNIKKMNLTDNKIETIAPEIAKLSNIKELFMLDNEFTAFPKELNVDELEIFDVKNFCENRLGCAFDYDNIITEF